MLALWSPSSFAAHFADCFHVVMLALLSFSSMAAHFADCFHVVMLALWSLSSMAAHFADCFHVVMLSLWSSSTMAAHFADCFHVVMLALWSLSSIAAHFADCFHVVMLSLWSSSTMAAHFADCFLVVMLALRSSSMAVHIANCFLSVCIVMRFGAASGDKDEVSREENCPAGTLRLYNVVSTSMQHIDVLATLYRRHMSAGWFKTPSSFPVGRSKANPVAVHLSLCVFGFIYGVCVVLICSSSLLLLVPSGGPCFVTVAFSGYLLLYL